jgi:hypothetical protein
MSEQEIDSQLKEMLDLLRPVPRRNPEAIRRSRSRFNTDLDFYFPVEASYQGAVVAPVVKSAPIKARPRTGSYRPVFAYLALALVIVMAMVSGGVVTALAAGSALPGDALYPLKLEVEQARLSLTTNPERQAELYLQFAEKRLDEMNALAELGQYAALEQLAAQYNFNVAMALHKAQDLENRKPDQALRLRAQAAQALGVLKQTFDVVISNAPPALQPVLQSAFERAAQPTPPPSNANGGKGNPGGGNQNAGNANNNGNPPGQSIDANTNANANANAGGAPGTTINSNGNDNSNANPNANPNSNKDKDKNNNGQDKDKDKNNNGRGDDKDKNNNGKNDR